MKVYITSTPEYSHDKIQSIISILKEVPGKLEFIEGKQLTVKNIQLGFRDTNINFDSEWTFEDLFFLSNIFRMIFDEISDDEFVVVLTTIKNPDGWLSAFSDKNVSINVDDWESLADNKPDYGIAYQIVENIFQSYSGLDIKNYKNDPNIHFTSYGCINDYNDDEKNVIIKLRAGFICESCMDRAKSNGIPGGILVHIHKIILYFRDMFSYFELAKSYITPDPIIVDMNGKITIAEKTIELRPLNKAIYLFFIKQEDGVNTKNIGEYEEELYNWYSKVKRNAHLSVIKNLYYTEHRTTSTFEKNRNIIKTELKSKLGELLYKLYEIDNIQIGDNNIYKIQLEFDARQIDPRF